jgi:hypothetical protein
MFMSRKLSSSAPSAAYAQIASRRLSDAELDTVSGGRTLALAQASRTGKKARLTGGGDESSD